MRALVLLAAVSVSAPTPSEELAENARWCASANTFPAHRVAACDRLIEAGLHTRRAIAEAHLHRGLANRDTGRLHPAIADLSAAIAADPDFALAYQVRGTLYDERGRFRLALRDFDRAIELAPDFAAALRSKAWLLATVDDGTLRDGPQAVRLAERALQLVAYPEHRGTLAAAYAESGRFEDAVRLQEAAIAGLRATGRITKLPIYRTRLELYRASLPYRR